jgi:hypothetical protein
MILSVPKQGPQPGFLNIDPSGNIEYLCPFLVPFAGTASHFTNFFIPSRHLQTKIKIA